MIRENLCWSRPFRNKTFSKVSCLVMKMIYFIFYLQSIRDYFILKKKILVTYLVHYGMKIFIVFQETSQCLCEKKRGDVLGSLVLTTPYIFSVFSLYCFFLLLCRRYSASYAVWSKQGIWQLETSKF